MRYDLELTRKSIDFHGYEIQTYSIGHGEKKIFVFPSFPQPGLGFVWWLSHYDLNKATLITFDLPGWAGYSDNVFKDRPFDLHVYVEIAKKIIKDYDMDEFSLIGYSYGCSLAILLANDLGEKVKKIALVSPLIKGDLTDKKDLVKLVRNMRKFRMTWVMKLFVLFGVRNMTRGNNKIPAKLLQNYIDMFNGVDAKVVTDSVITLLNGDLTDELLKLKDRDLMIVSGRKEEKMFKVQSEYVRRLLPAEKSIYTHGNHDDFLLNPEREIVKEVLHFLLR